MLKCATFSNFTTVPNGEWTFSPGLNVIIGENGLGKSHVLKSIYALLKVQATRSPEDFSKSSLEKAYAEKLIKVLRPESLGRLVKRRQGRERCGIRLQMEQAAQGCAIEFATNAQSRVEVIEAPTEPLTSSPVYLPTRELITLCPWFGPLYENYHLEFEETWRDTLSLLGAPSVKGPREKQTTRLLAPLEVAMGGKVVIDNHSGRFYLKVHGEGQIEMPLVAEGVRKLAMLARLISTGALLDNGYLFWDEPETNLNPKLIKTVATNIFHLAATGIQTFIATHSLFLLRELEMLASTSQKHGTRCRWFALALSESGVMVEQEDHVDDLKTIVMLDEELAQSDRFMASAD